MAAAVVVAAEDRMGGDGGGDDARVVAEEHEGSRSSCRPMSLLDALVATPHDEDVPNMRRVVGYSAGTVADNGDGMVAAVVAVTAIGDLSVATSELVSVCCPRPQLLSL